jgi:hypothetical protein
MKTLVSLFIACASLLLVACGGSTTKNGTANHKTVDVLVIGASTSGTSAGISAAREGVATLIVAESPWLGGMFSAQGVGAADGNHNMPSGIWNEFRDKLRTHYGGAAALETGWVSNTQFEPHVGDSIFKALAAQEKNLEVAYGYHLVQILKDGNTVTGAVFENNKKETLTVLAKLTIDATDIGESFKMAGADYRLGMDAKADTGEANAPDTANDIVQDLTWVAILKDYGKGADKTIARPDGYNADNFKGCCKTADDQDVIDCDKMLTYGKLPNQKYMINWPTKGNDIYLNIVELPYAEREKELEKAKNYTLQFVYYIQTELGYKHLGLADDEFDTPDKLAYKPYHREGRRIKGLSFMTYNHVTSPYDQPEALYRTGISVGDYPVDHHHKQNPQAPKLEFPAVPAFNIPLGALIPQSVDGLIVSDKAISVSNLINGSTRLQPVVLLTGQAAGTLAALAVRENKQPREVSIRQVQSRLLAANTYIMPLFDVQPTDKDFAVLQKIAATGILKTVGEPYKWANRTWFYPENTITEQEFTAGLNTYNPVIEVSVSTKPLTQKQALAHIAKVAGKELTVDGLTDKPITRRALALLLNAQLDPFAREIDFKGQYK